MRIAFISTILSQPWGGGDALWTSAAEAALARQDRVLMVLSELTAPNERITALVKRGAELKVRPRGDQMPNRFVRALYRTRQWLGWRDRLVTVVGAFQPDLVILSCGGTYDPILEWPLCEWLRETGTRYRSIANMQREHLTESEFDRLRLRALFGSAEKLFFVSQRNLEITRRHLLHPLPHAECIHGCAVHNPVVPAVPLPWPDAPPWNFATIGRLDPIKGVDLLLRALTIGLHDAADWRLNIHGNGPQREYLVAAAREFGLSDRVAFPGFVREIDDVWRTNHLLLSPAIDEGIPLTLLEAMLRGRPALATAVGGAEEWIRPNETGFICPAPTPELLAATLRIAWEARHRWQPMGQLAATETRANYRPNDYLRIIT